MYPSSMTITISNDSALVFARGYAHTEERRAGEASITVWLKIAQRTFFVRQHPKAGAIWASLVSGHHPYLQLKDSDGVGGANAGQG